MKVSTVNDFILPSLETSLSLSLLVCTNHTKVKVKSLPRIHAQVPGPIGDLFISTNYQRNWHSLQKRMPCRPAAS